MRYIIIAIFFICLYACQEDKFTTYNSENYVQFSSALEDSTTVSFIFYPGKNELLLNTIYTNIHS